jgi:predicted translin family RNA/ssDNA-binding protein
MIKKAFIQKLKKEHIEKNKERTEIIRASNPILHDSKRIIFSLHRQDFKKAETDLKQLEESIKKLQKNLGVNRLEQEGSYKAAMEEFLEAHFFWQWLTKYKIEKSKELKISHESYLGAISDLLGEISRYSTNQATKQNTKEVTRASEDAAELLAALTEFDFTGYLRTKYDQARGHLKKIEQVNYDISIRK